MCGASRLPSHTEQEAQLFGSVSIVRRFDSPKIQLKLKLALTLTLTLTDTGDLQTIEPSDYRADTNCFTPPKSRGEANSAQHNILLSHTKISPGMEIIQLSPAHGNHMVNSENHGFQWQQPQHQILRVPCTQLYSRVFPMLSMGTKISKVEPMVVIW